MFIATAIKVTVNLAGITSAMTSTHVMHDSGASHGIFHNRDLLTNIRTIADYAEIRGMGGAPIYTNEVGEFMDLSTVYIADGAIVNVLSNSWMSDHGIDIEYDNIAQTYTVRNPEISPMKETVFGRVGGLYAVDMEQRFAFASTVAERALKYTKRDLKKAEQAREIQRRLGYPSDADLAKIAGGGGAVTNVPVTAKDIARAEDIFGPDASAIKGKMRQGKSKHVIIEESYRPNDILQKYLVDLYFVHVDPYLIGLIQPVDFTQTTHLTDRSTESIRSAMRAQFAEIASQEYEVETILVDGEGGIAALEDEIKEAGYEFNTSGPKQHVPAVERKIETLKGRIRSIHHSLPWNLPYSLLRYEVKYATLMLSMVPCNTRVDPTSAYEQFYGRKVNLTRQLALSFGDYVEVHNNQQVVSNNIEERALSCIALLPLLNQQGTYLFFSLKSRRVLKGDKWKALPTPQWVIDRMNLLARNQKRKLPEDPVFTRRASTDDLPHIPDEDLFDAINTEQEVDNFDEEDIGPNDRDDWEDAIPEEIVS